MEDNDLHPEPEPNEPNNEHEADEEGNILNISQSSQSLTMGFPQTLHARCLARLAQAQDVDRCLPSPIVG